MERKEAKGQNGGFTLIELLAALLISAILLAGLYSVFSSQNVVYSAQEQVAEMSQNIRAALDLMTREIRLAGYKPSASTFQGIASATPSSIRVLADLNQDGDTLDEYEDITYSYDSNSKQIWRNGATFPVADHIDNLFFEYTLSNGTVTSNPANPAEIRKIRISIQARTSRPDMRSGQYRTITLTSDITPRNLDL